MSDISATIRAMLLDSSEVTAFTAQRISADMLLQGSLLPASVIWVVSSSANECLGGAVSVMTSRVQINSYATTRAECNALAETIRVVLQGYRGTFNGQQIMAITVESGERHGYDRPFAGTQDMTPITTTEFSVVYRIPTSLPINGD